MSYTLARVLPVIDSQPKKSSTQFEDIIQFEEIDTSRLRFTHLNAINRVYFRVWLPP